MKEVMMMTVGDNHKASDNSIIKFVTIKGFNSWRLDQNDHDVQIKRAGDRVGDIWDDKVRNN